MGGASARPQPLEIREAFSLPRGTCVLAAHPEDETIAVGATLAQAERASLLYLTRDGDPARDEAWKCAAKLARVDLSRVGCLGAREGDAARELGALSVALAAELRRLRPQVLLSHPYEGGHPDHDAAAFVAHAAVALLEREEKPAPVLAEMACYHGWGGELVPPAFLPTGVPVHTRVLTPSERALKESMRACYPDPRESLAALEAAKVERVRHAPTYDFTARPHEGALWYERRGVWTFEAWRACASAALEELGLASYGPF